MLRRLHVLLITLMTGCYLSHEVVVPASDAGRDAAADIPRFDVNRPDMALDTAADASGESDVPLDSAGPDECVLNVVADATLLYSDRAISSPRLVRLPDEGIAVVSHDPGTGRVSYQRFTETLNILGAAQFLEARSLSAPSVAYFDGLIRVGVALPDGDFGQIRSFNAGGSVAHIGIRFPAFAPVRLIPARESMLWVGVQGGSFGSLQISHISTDAAPTDVHDIQATIDADDLVAVVRPDGRSFVLAYTLFTGASLVSAFARILDADGGLGDAIPLSPESDAAVFPIDLSGRLIFVRHTPGGLYVEHMDYDTLELLERSEFPARDVPPQVGTFDGRLIAASVNAGELHIDNYGRDLRGPQTVTRRVGSDGSQTPELLELPDAIIVSLHEQNGRDDSIRLFRVECTN